MKNRKKPKNKKPSQNSHVSKLFKSDKLDPFLDGDSKTFNDSINSSDSETNVAAAVDGGELEEEETAAEKRKRLAKAYLQKMREAARREEEDGDEEGSKKDGDGDSLVARMLQAKQLEDSDRLRKLIAKR